MDRETDQSEFAYYVSHIISSLVLCSPLLLSNLHVMFFLIICNCTLYAGGYICIPVYANAVFLFLFFLLFIFVPTGWLWHQSAAQKYVIYCYLPLVMILASFSFICLLKLFFKTENNFYVSLVMCVLQVKAQWAVIHPPAPRNPR